MTQLEVETKLIPLNSLYRCVRSRSILSKRGREVKTALEWEIASQWKNKPLKGSVALNIIMYFGDKRRRDIDAYLKVLLDGMNKIVYEDDSQVTEMHCFKVYKKGCHNTVIQVL